MKYKLSNGRTVYGPTAHDADQGRRRPCHHYSMDPVAGMEVAGAGHYPWHSSMNLLNGTDLEQKKEGGELLSTNSQIKVEKI